MLVQTQTSNILKIKKIKILTNETNKRSGKKTFAYRDNTLYHSRGLQELTTGSGQASTHCSSESEQSFTQIYAHIQCIYIKNRAFRHSYGGPEGTGGKGGMLIFFRKNK